MDGAGRLTVKHSGQFACPALLSRFTWPDGKTFEGFYAKDVKAKCVYSYLSWFHS